MSDPVWIIGVGAGPGATEGLSPDLVERIRQADQLWGGARLLAPWEACPSRKVVIGSSIAEQATSLRERGDQKVVVLASGDPGFFGIESTVVRALGPHEVRIVPHVTSLQLAFARAGITWGDAILTSAHARPLSEVIGWARRAPKLGILTDPVHDPAAIARALLAAGIPDCRAIVAENLGMPEERMVETRLSSLTGQNFAPLNVVLLVQDPGWSPRPVLARRPDSAYAHRRGLITKADVRALSLVRLGIAETDQIWDVGAGSGALSIEMAELSWRGRVWAVEHDPENLDFIRANLDHFGTPNVTVVPGRAPGVLAELSSPDAVFIGGAGGEMPGILRTVVGVARPGCRIVINLVTIEHLTEAIACLHELGLEPELAQASLAHGQAIGDLTRLVPDNPVFIVSGTVTTDRSRAATTGVSGASAA